MEVNLVGRINKDRIYILRDHPGISGFRDWGLWEYWIAAGSGLGYGDRLNILAEYEPRPDDQFRLATGQLPDYQPRAGAAAAIAALRANKISRAYLTAGSTFERF